MINEIYALGVLRSWVRAQNHELGRKFSGTCFFRVTFKSPPKSYLMFWTHIYGFHWNPNIFITLEPMQKFRHLRQPLIGILPFVRPKSPWHAKRWCLRFAQTNILCMFVWSQYTSPFHCRHCILATMNALHLSFFSCLPTMDDHFRKICAVLWDL